MDRKAYKKKLKKDLETLFKWTGDDDNRMIMLTHYLTEGKQDIEGMLELFIDPSRWGVYHNSLYRLKLGLTLSTEIGWLAIAGEPVRASTSIIENIKEFDFESANKIEIAYHKSKKGIPLRDNASIQRFVFDGIRSQSLSFLP